MEQTVYAMLTDAITNNTNHILRHKAHNLLYSKTHQQYTRHQHEDNILKMTGRPVNVVRPTIHDETSESEENQGLQIEQENNSDSDVNDPYRDWPNRRYSGGRGRILLEPNQQERERDRRRQEIREGQRRPRYRHLRNGQQRIRTPSPPFLIEGIRRP